MYKSSLIRSVALAALPISTSFTVGKAAASPGMTNWLIGLEIWQDA
jgi:hypothetical protein